MSTMAKHQKIASIGLVCLNEREQPMILSQTKFRDNITSSIKNSTKHLFKKIHLKLAIQDKWCHQSVSQVAEYQNIKV